MANKYINNDSNIETNFCRACLHPNAKKILNCKLFEDITTINVSSKKSTNWVCYKCEMVMRNFDKFKILCLQVDNFIKNVVDKRKRKCSIELFNSKRSELPHFKNLSISNIVHIDTNLSDDYNNYDEVPPHSEIISDLKSNIFNNCKTEVVISSFNSDDLIDEKFNNFEYSNDDSSIKLESHFDISDNESLREKNSDVIEKKVKKKKTKLKNIKSENNCLMTDSETDLRDEAQTQKDKVLIDKKPVNEIRLTKEEQLFEHQQRLMDEKYLNAQFRCETCYIAFRHEFTLKNHMEKHSETRGSHICTLCQQRFASARQLRAHTSLHSIRLICYACGARLRDRARLADHLAWHEGKTYICNLCNAVFVRKTTLKNHLRLKHNDDQFKCEYCNKIFNGKERLKEHELRHSSPAHGCEVCGKHFYTVANLSNHMISHSDARHYYCVECDVYFKSASILRNHLYNTAKHVDPSLLQFSCDQCAKRFRSKILLTQHVDATHLKRKQFSCEMCTASYASRQGLNFHRRLAHQGFRLPRSHQCTVCEKSFSAKGLLVNHLRVHTGEKPFECSQCHYKFSQKSSLRTHIKLVHLKLKRIIKKKNTTTTTSEQINEINLPIVDKTLSDDKQWENKIIADDGLVDANSSVNLQPTFFNSQIHDNQYL